MEKWNPDKVHSTIGFRVRHMVIARVSGVFEDWSANLQLDPDDLGASEVEARVKTESIETREPDRDAHLRSADFFDSENYPEMVFRSKRIEDADGERLTIVGDLTIKEVTREIELDARFNGRLTDPWGNDRVGFEAQAKLDRKDYGLVWNSTLETGGVLVDDTVELIIELEATRA